MYHSATTFVCHVFKPTVCQRLVQCTARIYLQLKSEAQANTEEHLRYKLLYQRYEMFVPLNPIVH